MDRGLVVGGALICASFLIAVALNQSDGEAPDNAPKKAIEAPTVEPDVTTPVSNCTEPDKKGPNSHPKQAAPECR